MKGNLYLVATPIGNFEDITLRALKVLKEVDAIICETTHQAKKLLSHFQIEKPLIHLSDENQLEKIPFILEKLNQGENLALISDAGTPIISDPGYFLVKQVIKNQVKIIPLPGPSAPLTPLVASGLSPLPFLFFGFLPKKENEIRKTIKQLKNIVVEKKSPTFIFFESPQRILKTLTIIKEETNDQSQICMAREMTKIHEEFIRGNPKEVIDKLKQKNTIKGEITLVVSFS